MDRQTDGQTGEEEEGQCTKTPMATWILCPSRMKGPSWRSSLCLSRRDEETLNGGAAAGAGFHVLALNSCSTAGRPTLTLA